VRRFDRVAGLVLLTGLAAATGCDVGGSTCGRGRCQEGATCVSVFGDMRKNRGWNDPKYPNTDNEWWCVRDCPDTLTCPGMCLENPTDSNAVICGGQQTELVFRSTGISCMCIKGGACYVDQPVSGFEIVDVCNSSYQVLKTCTVGEDCSAGIYYSGQNAPAVRLSSPGGLEFVYCPAQPGKQLGPILPQGEQVAIWADTDSCY